MDLTRYVREIQDNLLSTMQTVTDDRAEAVTDRVLASFATASQLVLLNAVVDAAAAISEALDGLRVEVRLRGREPEFVVLRDLDPAPSDFLDPARGTVSCNGELDLLRDQDFDARFTLRMPGKLKEQISAAAKGRSISMNSWLVTLAAKNL